MGRRFESCQAYQPGDPSRPVAAIAVGLIAGAVLVYGVLLRNTVPFGPGPDPFDYVQSAARLAAGRSLAVPIVEPSQLGVARAHAVFFVPEPFVPLPGGTHYGPLYPPGTALLMAPLVALLGVERGPYLLSPLLAAAGILVFYGIARTWLGRTHSLLAAGLLALSPVFLLPAKAPLSDVPALLLLLLAGLALARARDASGLVLAGLAFGGACVTRTSLVVLLPAALLAVGMGLSASAGVARLAGFLAGCAPPLAGLALFNASLYGAPWRSGYALLPDFFRPFALDYLPLSLPRWLLGLLMALGPATLALAIAAIILRRGRGEKLAALAVALVVLFHSLYRISGHVRLHRFLLPAVPILILLAVAELARRRWRWGAPALVVVAALDLAVAVGPYGLSRPSDLDPYVPRLDLGAVARQVGTDAIVFSRVWGGRLRAEEGTVTVHWGRASAPRARQLLSQLLATGRPVFLLDNEQFSRRAIWWLGENAERVPLATDGAFLYRLGEPRPDSPVPIRQFVPPGGRDEDQEPSR